MLSQVALSYRPGAKGGKFHSASLKKSLKPRFPMYLVLIPTATAIVLALESQINARHRAPLLARAATSIE